MLESAGFAWSVSEVEGNMAAGFLEGEIHLGITELNGGQSLSCFAQTNVRDDDVDILEWLVALTGIGSTPRARPPDVEAAGPVADHVENRLRRTGDRPRAISVSRS